MSGPASKRPKLHPLRQTSFPVSAETAAAYASARSETGSIANSTLSVLSNKGQPRGRGRPRKSLQITEDDIANARDGRSQTNKNATAKSVISTRSGPGADNADDEEDNEEEETAYIFDVDAAEDDEESRHAERKQKFEQSLSLSQAEKYNIYRGSKLKESVVRRIINQTVSQSVGKTQVEAVQWYTKAFAVEVIERAREVQLEWAKAYQSIIDEEKGRRREKLSKKRKELEQAKQDQAESGTNGVDVGSKSGVIFTLDKQVTDLERELKEHIPNKHKGGLLPDHLREALRRYKADGEGGGMGFDGLSHPLLGVHGAVAWTVGDGGTGRRLFR